MKHIKKFENSEEQINPNIDTAFNNAINSEGLDKYDNLYDLIVGLYESGDIFGIERIIDLALETKIRGYVRTVLIATKPIQSSLSDDKYRKLVDFLRL